MKRENKVWGKNKFKETKDKENMFKCLKMDEKKENRIQKKRGKGIKRYLFPTKM